ncbi:MAG TPA: ketoacyl-ACP synthase III [Amycolatopsis sp.]|jgi:3-oxoacyl-[acyl-carrier-protein] synthase-3|nr:ketoacyl-ACP synthase III [Amycolatopsis sp.]
MSGPGIGIVGTGSYCPKTEVTNEQIAGKAGVTPEWIERKTRIRARRVAAPSEATSDLATQAATAALERAGLSAERLDYIIVSTSTPDSPQPPTSCLVQHALGAYQAACLDINVVCSGFVYALELAHRLLVPKPGSYALVIAGDLYSRILDYTDRRTAVLLGDGAGAAVVGPVPAPGGIVRTSLLTRGDAHGLVRVAAGGSRRPASAETLANGEHFFAMNGRGVRDFVLDHVPPAIAGLLAAAHVRADEVAHFVPHQPNGNLLDELVDAANLANARTHRTLETLGNVGSASVPVTLDAANRSGQLSDGDLVLLAGFGGGMAIGLSLLRWSAPA